MLTILFLAANPYETERLKIDKECREIEEKIQRSINREHFKFISKWAVKIKNLQDFIREQNPNIIHFSGHGENPEIVLENGDGSPVSVPRRAIIRLLGSCENLELVIFNTCHSTSFAQEAIEKIDFAIGMDGAIADNMAITFSYGFYSSLGFGKTVKASFEAALTEIDLNDLSGLEIPKLYIKNGIKDRPLIFQPEPPRPYKKFIVIGIYVFMLVIANMMMDKNGKHPIPPDDYVLIQGGTFQMGSPKDENREEKKDEKEDDETQHKVEVGNFYMSKYEVTVEKFKTFIFDFNKNTRNRIENIDWQRNVSGGTQTDTKQPVIYVSWKAAKEYCEWLSGELSKGVRENEKVTVRLPTEAEWEYACRAGTTTAFSTGDNLTTDEANYDGNSPYNGNPKGKFIKNTTPVGSYPPNEWGLYDMHGNAYEWCSDWYGSHYYDECKEKGTVKNPTGPGSGKYHILRGGSWRSHGTSCRSADRPGDSSENPNNPVSYVSFRPIIILQLQ